MDKKAFLKNMLDKGKIDQERYDNAIVKIDAEDKAKTDYKADKGKLSDKQRINAIEKILGI